MWLDSVFVFAAAVAPSSLLLMRVPVIVLVFPPALAALMEPKIVWPRVQKWRVKHFGPYALVIVVDNVTIRLNYERRQVGNGPEVQARRDVLVCKLSGWEVWKIE